MLQLAIRTQNAAPHGSVAPPSMLIDLVAGARRSLDDDPSAARSYLDRIVELFSAPRPSREAPLLEAMPLSADAAIAKGGLTPWQVTRVCKHIDDRLERAVPVEALATIAGLSPGHFCRAFKVSIGETPHAFLVRQRIRRAQTLMLNTRDNLSQIACACGLTDQAHLTRLFRRLVGETPLVWRRTWQTS